MKLRIGKAFVETVPVDSPLGPTATRLDLVISGPTPPMLHPDELHSFEIYAMGDTILLLPTDHRPAPELKGLNIDQIVTQL